MCTEPARWRKGSLTAETERKLQAIWISTTASPGGTRAEAELVPGPFAAGGDGLSMAPSGEQHGNSHLEPGIRWYYYDTAGRHCRVTLPPLFRGSASLTQGQCLPL